MKAFTVIFAIFLVMPLFYLQAYASDDFYLDVTGEFGTEQLEEGLSEQEKRLTGDFDAKGNYDAGGALSRIWRSFINEFFDYLKSNINFFTTLLGLSLLSTLCTSFCYGSDTSGFIELIACATAAVLIADSVNGIVSQTVDAMYRLSDYSKAALPVVFTAAAAAGAVSSAATKFAAVSLALDVLMSVSQRLIIPSVYAYLALTVSNSLFSNPVLSSVQRLFKWVSGILMTGMTLAFTTYISMIGAIGTAVDAATVKTARTVISGVLPVVGGMISDASAMLVSAAGVVRSCSGVFGLIAVAAMCAGPFALLSVKMLLLKAASAIAEALQAGKISSLLSGVSAAMALLMGLLGSSGIMLFISITAGMKAVIP